jgi:hypothetical protein
MSIAGNAARAALESATADATLAEAPASAVAWPAIFGGACVAAAVALLLIELGAGIGLASISPLSGAAASAATFTVAAAIWLIVVQWLACALGGYVTGRLRTKWARVHADEVFFRDTAHGFLTWAVAVLFAAALFGAAAATAIGGGARAAGGVLSGAAQGASQVAAQGANPLPGAGYFTDSLLRAEHPSANAPGAAPRAEVGGILAMALSTGEMQAADKTYLAQLIAAHTGLSEADAAKRVDSVMAGLKAAEEKARAAADAARKAAASFAFFTFFSLLIGAFIASVAAAIGGQQRDAY